MRVGQSQSDADTARSCHDVLMPENELTDVPQRVACPHCAESVLPNAVVCRFCGLAIHAVGHESVSRRASEAASMTRSVSSGVLRALGVAALVVLVAVAALAGAEKKGSMEDSEERGSALLRDGLPPGASPSELQLRASDLRLSAQSLQEEADGPFAAFAGDSERLTALAEQSQRESVRLDELALAKS